jgi:hypothetical protein
MSAERKTKSGYDGQMRRILLLLVLTGLTAGPALAAKNPDLVKLEKTLKADMVKNFKKQAPSLKIGAVTCTIPSNGGAATHCKAYFTVSGTKGYYPVTTKFHDLGGTNSWTAQAPKCLNPKSKKYTPC